MRTHLFILTCAILAGCTRSERPPAAVVDAPRPAPPQRPQARAAVDTRPAIVVLGDSLAEGFGVAPGHSYPDLIQRKLDANGYEYRIVNLGISGDTTTGGLGRISHALSLKPAILIVELGGNDGLRGVSAAATRANLDRIITTAQAGGTEVLLAGMTLPRNYGPEYIKKFEGIYKELAEKHRVQLIPSLMQGIVDGIESRPDLMQRDGIHPTADGHELLADTVFRYLQPMLRRS